MLRLMVACEGLLEILHGDLKIYIPGFAVLCVYGHYIILMLGSTLDVRIRRLWTSDSDV